MIVELAAGLGAASVMTLILFWPGGRRAARAREARAEEARRAARAPLALLLRTDDPDLREALSALIERTAAGLPTGSRGQAATKALGEVRRACLTALDQPATLAPPKARRELAGQARRAVEAMRPAPEQEVHA